jgi:hypothetical protein
VESGTEHRVPPEYAEAIVGDADIVNTYSGS